MRGSTVRVAMKILPALIVCLAGALSAHAKLVTQSVAYEQGGVKLSGYLAYDDRQVGENRIPGILVVPEWWGLNDYVKGRAQQLAEVEILLPVGDLDGDLLVEPRVLREVDGAEAAAAERREDLVLADGLPAEEHKTKYRL